MFGSRTGGATHDTLNSGGASRFFPVFKYQAKAPKRERPVIEREDGTKVQHPTVKPLALLEWLSPWSPRLVVLCSTRSLAREPPWRLHAIRVSGLSALRLTRIMWR